MIGGMLIIVTLAFLGANFGMLVAPDSPSAGQIFGAIAAGFLGLAIHWRMEELRREGSL